VASNASALIALLLVGSWLAASLVFQPDASD
jgi:hypothetical protein